MKIETLLARFCLPLSLFLLAQTARADDVTSATGGGEAHSNIAPSLTVNFLINTEGSFPGTNNSGTGAMIGEIRWSSDLLPPAGWLRCEGQQLMIGSNPFLFNVLGTRYGGDGITTFRLPDLRGRTPIGAGQGPGLTNRALGEVMGEEAHSLSVDEMPAHLHVVPGGGSSEATGGGEVHANMQPSLALHYLIQTFGEFPTEGGNPTGDRFVAEVRLFAGDFEPNGWLFCDGRLIDISSNVSMFALIGTAYGGDGITTFALPDLRGRTAVGRGQGPGLTDRPIGTAFGEESVDLNVSELPVHTHEIFGVGSTAPAGNDEAHNNQQPSLAMTFMVRDSGPLPSAMGSPFDSFTAEMRIFAGDFVPSGFLPTDGLVALPNDIIVLFSLIGNAFGGNGQTNFALPDMRGRCAIGRGQAPGLASYSIGDALGTETVQLTEAQLPFHTHDVFSPMGNAFCSGDGGDQMGCTDCPCANNAAAGTLAGCLNSAGTSTQLIPSGSASIAAANLRFEALGMPPSNTAVLTSGNALAPANMANPCFGQDSGVQSLSLDGVRCAVQGVLRHGVRPSNANGEIGATTNGWGTPNGFFNFGAFVAGSTKHFQLIHRDDSAAVCMTGQNTSQAISVGFQP